ncbi:MAG: LuxR family transcriptional regulator [Sphingomonadales bacterium]|nr:LuxR family transcriptional regulator [Sphingomonadaceae bacterium]MBS3929640.1 LuxR family transcriptional regulator [Sphingomonadales bacterium]
MKHATVSLIDSDFSRRAQVVYGLGKLGLHVEPFEDFEEFAARVEGREVLLIHDDGRTLEETIRWARQSIRAVGVIAYSENPALQSIVAAMKCGAYDYIEWPFEPHAVKATIARCIEQKQVEWDKIERKLAADSMIRTLTPRERQVLGHMTQGQSSRMIGNCLGISSRTVEIHRANILHKISATNSLDAVRIAHEAGVPAEWSTAA